MVFDHPVDFGNNDICNLWHAGAVVAAATVEQFRRWCARYFAIFANQHGTIAERNSETAVE